MTKVEEFQTATYEYISMIEMGNHIKTMTDAGWMVVSVNHVSRRAVYKKNLP